ncbi:Inner membrane protein yecN [Serratia fonticola]|uniref:Inner membrane protein yecN n=1 Tax=Serratia fonticola TaxID=47917 RepID=A0A4U9TPS0_SERFO|nr:Inner membrane protein yecN [Serratia fonticola]
MVSALYVVLGALLLIKLSYDVVRLRMQYRVATVTAGSTSCKPRSAYMVTPWNTSRSPPSCW